MKQLKVTVYYSLNKDSFVRTYSLSRRISDDEAIDKAEVQRLAALATEASLGWKHVGDKITMRNIQVQVVEELY